MPALKYDWLTRFFDPFMKIFMPDKGFKKVLIDQGEMEFNPGIKVLDFGCGTATLSIMIKEQFGRSQVYGIDVDAKILSIARDKLKKKNVSINLAKYDGGKLPYPSNTFDRVFSSLVFHHLTPLQKGKALEEIYRVLKAGGQLHIADWGKPKNKFMRMPFYLVSYWTALKPLQTVLQGSLPVIWKMRALKK